MTEKVRESPSVCLMKYTLNSEHHTLHRQNFHLFFMQDQAEREWI